MILEIYKNLMDPSAGTYMLNQVLTILVLFLAGFAPVMLIREKISMKWALLLSFPVGLSIYSVLGFLLLITGIRFQVKEIFIAYVVLFLMVMIRRAGSRNKVNINHQSMVNINPDLQVYIKYLPLIPAVSALVVIPALIACSGVLPQTVTNDSVYYYSVYPSILVHDGFYTASLDKFLTDVGQTTAIIQCLPFMFGYDETFGIQHFFNYNFILIFFTALYDEFKVNGGDKKNRIILPFLCTLFLITSEPFIVLSGWILSNAYFMGSFFILTCLFIKTSGEEKLSADYVLIMVFISAMLIMSRMEGGVMVFILALALSSLDVEGKRLLLIFGLPLGVMELGYYVNLYLKIGINPLYSFLDMKTAIIMTGMIAAFIVYIMFIRDRLPKGYIPLLLTLMLILGNLGLLIINHERYLTNIKAFIMNIRLGNGWGSFAIMILIYILILAYEVIRRRFKDIPVEVFLPAVMVLTVFAVCFARGGVLAVRTSDSGNRVLMEMVPVIAWCVFIAVFKKKEAGK